MSFKAGQTVGPYQVIEQLGQGGMATVFKAYHPALDRYVALKVLHPVFMQDPNFLARFQREAKVVAKLEHPHIVPIYDFAEQDGSTYLVMKFVEGETLKARLKTRPLTPEEGIQIIEAVGEALAYAHQHGILHRDVKPSNVLLSADGGIYLTDFGLARIASAGESTISSDIMLGTPQYISPEQALGNRDLDEGTDIYSFGVLAYELVVGQVPFSADTPISIVHDHIYAPLPLPSQVNPHVPEAVERVLLRALAKSRADRFKSIQEMVAAFRAAVGGKSLAEAWPATAAISRSQTLPVSESGASDASPPEKPRRRWRWWYLIPIAFGLFACLVLLGALSNRRNRNQGSVVITPVVEATLAPARTPSPTQDDSPPPDLALEEALLAVEENPDDPYAYLGLAGAYMDLGKEPEAEEALVKGTELAGEDPEFQLVAGDMFSARERWLPALEHYVLALDYGLLLPMPGFGEKVSQAAYFAAELPESQEILFREEVGRRDFETQTPGVLQSARARYVMLHESPERAISMVKPVLDDDPDFPEGLLVQAEILAALGEVDQARLILKDLSLRRDIPSWVQIETRRQLAEIGA